MPKAKKAVEVEVVKEEELSKEVEDMSSLSPEQFLMDLFSKMNRAGKRKVIYGNKYRCKRVHPRVWFKTWTTKQQFNWQAGQRVGKDNMRQYKNRMTQVNKPKFDRSTLVEIVDENS